MHRKFVELFGPHLWEVKFGWKWEFASVLAVLRSTPNLQKLEFLPTSETKGSWLRVVATDQIGKLNLPKLKQLKLQMCDEEADFLQLLLHATNDGLDSIEIQTNKMVGKTAEKLGRTLREVPHIGITMGSAIHGNCLTVLGEQFLSIRKLELSLREPNANGSNQVELFRPIERLLDRLDTLEELKLSVIQEADGFSKASFTFPNRMESLRTLNIHFLLRVGGGQSESTNFVSNILSTLEPDQVPILEKVIISTPLGSFYYTKLGNVTIFNSAYRFDSVRVLKLRDTSKHYLKDDWSQVFPNVRSLDVKCYSGFIAYVFTKMDHLEHLILRVLEKDGVNGLLCGIPEPDRIYQLPEDVIKQLRFSYASPSLLNLTSKTKTRQSTSASSL